MEHSLRLLVGSSVLKLQFLEGKKQKRGTNNTHLSIFMQQVVDLDVLKMANLTNMVVLQFCCYACSFGRRGYQGEPLVRWIN